MKLTLKRKRKTLNVLPVLEIKRRIFYLNMFIKKRFLKVVVFVTNSVQLETSFIMLVSSYQDLNNVIMIVVIRYLKLRIKAKLKELTNKK